ncbi:chloramphenicol phosphotransferase CPT family protein [Lichenicoccus sp.]|uniref:chloramphenicol phosphotransferase CPT family protein n=1 Tax=Lichenicoccus sp. TaxID=2781899 RepID=UPI003D0C0813
MADRPYVIILNGAGSVGKSSTAHALQEITTKPFLHVSMDVFIDMLPKRMFGHPDGMIFDIEQEQGAPSVVIKTGPVMARTMRGMRHAIAALAAPGNDLVVDDVMLEAGEADHYRALLTGVNLRFVGLLASLEVLEARERARGDRQLGLARWQFDRVHRGQRYDLEIETSDSTPAQNALRIRDAFRL